MGELDDWLQRDYPTVYRTACLVLHDPHEAEGAAREAFLRLGRFRDVVPGGDARRARLYRAVVNACISRLRSESVRTVQDDADQGSLLAGEPSGSGQGAEPALIARRTQPAVDVAAALYDLPERLRVPLVLRFCAGLSEKEIGVATQRRPGTIRTRLQDARRRLANDRRFTAWVADDDNALEGSP